MNLFKRTTRLLLLTVLQALILQAFAGDKTVTYYHTDHLGSPVLATDYLGRTVWREDYGPWGQPLLSPAGNKGDIGYTGHYTEQGLGLTYAQARWYDQVAGVFLSPDRVGFKVGGYRFFNRLSYVSQNPMTNLDPSGLFEVRAYSVMNSTKFQVVPAAGAMESGYKQAAEKAGGAARRLSKSADRSEIATALLAGKPASYTDNRWSLESLKLWYNEADVDGAAIYGYENARGMNVVDGLITESDLNEFISWSRDNVDGFKAYDYEGVSDRAVQNMKDGDSVSRYIPGMNSVNRHKAEMKEY